VDNVGHYGKLTTGVPDAMMRGANNAGARKWNCMVGAYCITDTARHLPYEKHETIEQQQKDLYTYYTLYGGRWYWRAYVKCGGGPRWPCLRSKIMNAQRTTDHLRLEERMPDDLISKIIMQMLGPDAPWLFCGSLWILFFIGYTSWDLDDSFRSKCK